MSAYEYEHLGNLIGYTVKAIHSVKDEENETWFEIAMERPDGHEVWVTPSRDPEGNGPGFLFIEEKNNV